MNFTFGILLALLLASLLLPDYIWTAAARPAPNVVTVPLRLKTMAVAASGFLVLFTVAVTERFLQGQARIWLPVLFGTVAVSASLAAAFLVGFRLEHDSSGLRARTRRRVVLRWKDVVRIRLEGPSGLLHVWSASARLAVFIGLPGTKQFVAVMRENVPSSVMESLDDDTAAYLELIAAKGGPKP